MTSRHYVTLYEKDGTVRAAADFEDAEAAEIYRKEAEAMARAIGGRVEASVELKKEIAK